MRHQGRRVQGKLIDYIEQQLGWEVTRADIREVEGYGDDPDQLELHIEAERVLDEDTENDYRHA